MADVERLKAWWRRGESLTREQYEMLNRECPDWIDAWQAYAFGPRQTETDTKREEPR